MTLAPSHHHPPRACSPRAPLGPPSSRPRQSRPAHAASGPGTATAGATPRSSAAASCPASSSTRPSAAWSTPAPTSAAPTGYDRRAERWVPLLDWVGWDQWGYTGRGQPGHRRGRPRPGLRRRRDLHQRLGPQQRARSCAPATGARTWKVIAAAVQAGRQHARPRHGRAPGHRPEPQQHPLPGRPERERAVAQHRPRGDLGAGGQLPQRRQLRRRPDRHQRVQQRQPGRAVGGLRPAHRQPAPGDADDLRRRGRQGEHPLPVAPTPGRPGSAVPGAPTGYIPHKGVLDHVGGRLYLATSDTGRAVRGRQG